MSNMMAVLLNGVAQLEFDRDKPLPPYQGAYLDKMDQQMDIGIDLDGQAVTSPDQDQRIHFVAGNLVHAIKTDNESLAAAMCTYLAVRDEELKQVKIMDTDGQISIEFVYDQAYGKQVEVSLTPLN